MRSVSPVISHTVLIFINYPPLMRQVYTFTQGKSQYYFTYYCIFPRIYQETHCKRWKPHWNFCMTRCKTGDGDVSCVPCSVWWGERARSEAKDKAIENRHVLNWSVFNDISPERYDIRQSCMIYLRSKYDIISVPSYAEHISSTAVDIISKDISPVPQGTDIIETL